MTRLYVFSALVCAFLLPGLVDAQEKTVALCDPGDPANSCPGDSCICIDDTLEVTFDGDSQSILEYEEYTSGLAVDVTVVTETIETEVQGWSYGIAHDMSALAVTEATTEDTTAAELINTGFDATSIEDIQTCGDDPDCEVGGRTEGGGWISAVVLSFISQASLPAGRNTLARASYTLEKDVGAEGTVIEISPDLAKRGSPSVALTVTVAGKAKIWNTGVNGWVKGPDDGPEPPLTEKVREICDPAATPDVCVPDTLEVTFDGDSQSIYEYEDFTQDAPLTVTMVTETRSEHVQGWSYGVAHDKEALTISEADIDGTDLQVLFDPDFDATSAEAVETCGDPRCTQENRSEGGGFISAVVLSFTKDVQLPLGRNSIAVAEYELIADVGIDGTLIQVTDRLAKELSPPNDINLVVWGKSKRWTTVVDGWVKQVGGVEPGTPFLRSDIGLSAPGTEQPADGLVNVTDAIRILRELFMGLELDFSCEKAADVDDNGILEVTDTVHLLQHLFQGNVPPAAPFPDVGQDPTPVDGLTCEFYP